MILFKVKINGELPMSESRKSWLPKSLNSEYQEEHSFFKNSDLKEEKKQTEPLVELKEIDMTPLVKYIEEMLQKKYRTIAIISQDEKEEEKITLQGETGNIRRIFDDLASQATGKKDTSGTSDQMKIIQDLAAHLEKELPQLSNIIDNKTKAFSVDTIQKIVHMLKKIIIAKLNSNTVWINLLNKFKKQQDAIQFENNIFNALTLKMIGYLYRNQLISKDMNTYLITISSNLSLSENDLAKKLAEKFALRVKTIYPLNNADFLPPKPEFKEIDMSLSTVMDEISKIPDYQIDPPVLLALAENMELKSMKEVKDDTTSDAKTVRVYDEDETKRNMEKYIQQIKSGLALNLKYQLSKNGYSQDLLNSFIKLNKLVNQCIERILSAYNAKTHGTIKKTITTDKDKINILEEILRLLSVHCYPEDLQSPLDKGKAIIQFLIAKHNQIATQEQAKHKLRLHGATGGKLITAIKDIIQIPLFNEYLPQKQKVANR
jgi:hypothetical protein